MKNTVIIIFALSLFFASCGEKASHQQNSASTKKTEHFQKISTAIPKAAPIAQQYTIDATQGGNIKTTSGAQIIIGGASFVHKDGTAVTGKVEVSFTEINSIAEIVASGIPMMAMNGNEMGQFISDGMFQISATEAGKEVALAPGKDLAVFTPVRDATSEFNYWYFDEAKGGWQDLGKREETADKDAIGAACRAKGISENEGITLYNLRWKRANEGIFHFASTQQIEIVQPSKLIPGKYNPKKAILDLQFDKTRYPDLEPYNRLMWQYAGNKDDMDPENNRWIYQSTWTDVNLTQSKEDKNLFLLSFIANGRNFSTVVRPVVSGKDLEKADKAMAEELKKAKELQEKVAEQGVSAGLISQNIYNAFNVAKMGTYNCDRFYSDPNVRSFTMDFKVDENILTNHPYYVLLDKKRGVLQFNSGSTARINPEVIDAVFLVAANGTIAALGGEELTQIRNSKGGSFAMSMQKLKTKIVGLATLNEALNEL